MRPKIKSFSFYFVVMRVSSEMPPQKGCLLVSNLPLLKLKPNNFIHSKLISCCNCFGKIILQRANVIILDEPTNHLDMESIESLNHALSLFEGTTIFVSHDREFISSLATRIIEIKKDKIIDIEGDYKTFQSGSI